MVDPVRQLWDRDTAHWYATLLQGAVAHGAESLEEALAAADLALEASPASPAWQALASEGARFALEAAGAEGGWKRQGPSGRWFTKTESGRVCPLKRQPGAHPEHSWPAPRDDQHDTLAKAIRELLADPDLDDPAGAVFDLLDEYEGVPLSAAFGPWVRGQSRSGRTVWTNPQRPGDRRYQEKEPGTRKKKGEEPPAGEAPSAEVQPAETPPPEPQGVPDEAEQASPAGADAAGQTGQPAGEPQPAGAAEPGGEPAGSPAPTAPGKPVPETVASPPASAPKPLTSAEAKAKSASGEHVPGVDSMGRRICYKGGQRTACADKNGIIPAPKQRPDMAGAQTALANASAATDPAERRRLTVEAGALMGQMSVKDLQTLRQATDGAKYARTKPTIQAAIIAARGLQEQAALAPEAAAQPPVEQPAPAPEQTAPEASPAPVEQTPAPQAAEAEAVHQSFMSDFADLLESDEHSLSGLVPIYKLRDMISAKYGEEAASAEQFDKMVLDAWRNGELRLQGSGASDERLTPEQFDKSIPGRAGSSYMYVEPPIKQGDTSTTDAKEYAAQLRQKYGAQATTPSPQEQPQQAPGEAPGAQEGVGAPEGAEEADGAARGAEANRMTSMAQEGQEISEIDKAQREINDENARADAATTQPEAAPAETTEAHAAQREAEARAALSPEENAEIDAAYKGFPPGSGSREALREATAFGKAKKAPAAPASEFANFNQKTLMASVADLMREEHAGFGRRVPIYKLREMVRQKYGEKAASDQVFNEAVLQLWRDKKARLVPISDMQKTSKASIAASVPGHHETLYLVDLPGDRTHGMAGSEQERERDKFIEEHSGQEMPAASAQPEAPPAMTPEAQQAEAPTEQPGVAAPPAGDQPASASAYDVLGVGPKATDAQIRKAYQAALAAVRAIPDAEKTPEDHAKFDAAQKAYEAIASKNQRRVYDLGRKGEKPRGVGWHQGVGALSKKVSAETPEPDEIATEHMPIGEFLDNDEAPESADALSRTATEGIAERGRAAREERTAASERPAADPAGMARAFEKMASAPDAHGQVPLHELRAEFHDLPPEQFKALIDQLREAGAITLAGYEGGSEAPAAEREKFTKGDHVITEHGQVQGYAMVSDPEALKAVLAGQEAEGEAMPAATTPPKPRSAAPAPGPANRGYSSPEAKARNIAGGQVKADLAGSGKKLPLGEVTPEVAREKKSRKPKTTPPPAEYEGPDFESEGLDLGGPRAVSEEPAAGAQSKKREVKDYGDKGMPQSDLTQLFEDSRKGSEANINPANGFIDKSTAEKVGSLLEALQGGEKVPLVGKAGELGLASDASGFLGKVAMNFFPSRDSWQAVQDVAREAFRRVPDAELQAAVNSNSLRYLDRRAMTYPADLDRGMPAYAELLRRAGAKPDPRQQSGSGKAPSWWQGSRGAEPPTAANTEIEELEPTQADRDAAAQQAPARPAPGKPVGPAPAPAPGKPPDLMPWEKAEVSEAAAAAPKPRPGSAPVDLGGWKKPGAAAPAGKPPDSMRGHPHAGMSEEQIGKAVADAARDAREGDFTAVEAFHGKIKDAARTIPPKERKAAEAGLRQALAADTGGNVPIATLYDQASKTGISKAAFLGVLYDLHESGDLRLINTGQPVHELSNRDLLIPIGAKIMGSVRSTEKTAAAAGKPTAHEKTPAAEAVEEVRALAGKKRKTGVGFSIETD